MMEMNMVLDKLNAVLNNFETFTSAFVLLPAVAIAITFIAIELLYIKEKDVRYKDKDGSELTLWQTLVNVFDNGRTEKLNVITFSIIIGVFSTLFLLPSANDRKENCIKAIQLERELRSVVDEEMMKIDANIELQYGRLQSIIVKCKNDIY